MQTPAPHAVLLIGFAIIGTSACTSVPSAPIPEALPEVLAWTRGHQGEPVFLGLEVRENDSDSLEDLFFAPGVRVVSVADGSPAAQAGVQVGDVVLRLADETVNDPASLRALLAQQSPGVSLALQVQRGDAIFELEASPREPLGDIRPTALVAVVEPARTLAHWMRGAGGVVLLSSHPQGPLARSGIPDGAVITHLDAAPLRSERSLVRRVLAKQPGETALFRWHTESIESRETIVTLYVPNNRLLEATLPVLIGYIGSSSGESSTFYLFDFWLIWLFKYKREGLEHHYSFLRFISWSTGEGLLGSQP